MEPMQVLTVQQVANMFDMSPITVQRHLRKGDIPGLKIGETWRIYGPALYRWCDGQATWPKQSAEELTSGAQDT